MRRNVTYNWRLLLVGLALLPTLVPSGISVYVCLTSARYHVQATGGCSQRACCEVETPVKAEAPRGCCSMRAAESAEGPVTSAPGCDCCIELASFETDEYTVGGAHVVVDLAAAAVASIAVSRPATVTAHVALRRSARPPRPPLTAPLLL